MMFPYTLVSLSFAILALASLAPTWVHVAPGSRGHGRIRPGFCRDRRLRLLRLPLTGFRYARFKVSWIQLPPSQPKA